MAERSSQWRGVFCPTTRRLFADYQLKTAKVIITPTLIVTIALVIALAAWAVRKDLKKKKPERIPTPEEESVRIGVPLDDIERFGHSTSAGLKGTIDILGKGNKQPQLIEHLKILIKDREESGERIRRVREEEEKKRKIFS